MLCRVCRSPMIDNGKGFLVCTTPLCDYICTIPRLVKSQAELIEENERLRKIIEQMTKEVSHNAPGSTLS